MSFKAQVRFSRVKEELVSGAPRKEVIKKLSNEFGVTDRTIEKAIALANKELEKEAAGRKEVQAYLLREQLERTAKESLVTDSRVDNYLSEIITGSRKEEKIMWTSKGYEVIQIAPSNSDVLRAISLYFIRKKMMEKDNPTWSQDVSWTIDGIPWDEFGKGDNYCKEYIELNKKYGHWEEGEDATKK